MSIETALITSAVAGVVSAGVGVASAAHSIASAQAARRQGEVLADIERQRAIALEQERRDELTRAMGEIRAVAAAFHLDPSSRMVTDIELAHARAALADIAAARLNSAIGVAAIRERTGAVVSGYYGQALASAGGVFEGASEAYRAFATWRAARSG